jgi:hypothetical protein
MRPTSLNLGLLASPALGDPGLSMEEYHEEKERELPRDGRRQKLQIASENRPQGGTSGEATEEENAQEDVTKFFHV